MTLQGQLSQILEENAPGKFTSTKIQNPFSKGRESMPLENVFHRSITAEYFETEQLSKLCFDVWYYIILRHMGEIGFKSRKVQIVVVEININKVEFHD